MNMDEWQRRMREEKQKDREKKNESANILKTYKGGVSEDEMKLTALKKEDRQKKTESAQLLQSYKGGLKDEDTKLAAMKKEDMAKRSEATQYLQGYRGSEPIETSSKPIPEKPDLSNLPTPVKGPQRWDPSQEIQEGTVSSLASGLRNKEGNIPTPPDGLERKVAGMSVGKGSGVVDAEPIAAEESKVVFEEKKANDDTAAEETEPHFDENLEEDPVMVDSSELPLPADVMFSFGIITKSSEPAISGYIQAAQNIISSSMVADKGIVYEPSFTIEVKDCKQDGKSLRLVLVCELSKFCETSDPFPDRWMDPQGRFDVKRFLVVACVTVLRSRDITETKANEIVISCLADAMKNGSFVTMAKNINKE